VLESRINTGYYRYVTPTCEKWRKSNPSLSARSLNPNYVAVTAASVAASALPLSCRRNLVLTAKHVLVQVLITELALGVVLPTELNKVRHLFVKAF
jgi:hypothetical protein